MIETIDTSRNRSIKTVFLAIFLVGIFMVGFISGGSYIYGLSSEEFDDLQNKIDTLAQNNFHDIQNITYYYNETSLSALYDHVKDSIVVITGMIAYQTFFGTQYSDVQGSGFIYSYDDQMVVVTNNHVIADASDIVITFSNGNSYPGNVIGSDAYADLALLSVDAPDLEYQPLTIISSSNLEVGDPVIAIGSPMGLQGSMTTGIVSQIGRTIEESLAGSFPIANIIQTSVPINPGNSGGPLLNYDGDVVGITTAIIEDSEGLGFAIPSNTILREIQSLVETGSYNEHPWLGIAGTDMNYGIANALDTNTTYGWLIASVTAGGAAEAAGLHGGNNQVIVNNNRVVIGGDIIIAIDGHRIINGDTLMSYVEENTKPKQTIIITIIRDNAQMNIPLTVGIRPALP